MADLKQDLRKKVRRQAQNIRDAIANKEEKEKAIVGKLLPFLEGISSLGIYMPIRSEVNILSSLPHGIQLAAPVVLSDNMMKFASAENLRAGAYRILEPDPSLPEMEVEAILVPLCAFHANRRLGYGKGYYDRWICYHPTVKTIGLAFEEQHLTFPFESWDEPLDLIITDQNVYSLKEEK